jgi:hypothetical protein
MGKRGLWLVGPFLGLLGGNCIASPTRLVGNIVYVNESPVLVIRSGNPTSRTRSFVSSLNRFSGGAKARAESKGSKAQIFLGDRSVFRVEIEDADAAGTSPLNLAKSWASNLNKALSLPPLAIGSKSVSMGNGRELRIPLSGRLALKASAASSDETVVKVRKEPGNLVLTGSLAGSAKIVVTSGSQISTISVNVMPLAAVFPQNVAVSVTGVPAIQSMCRGAVESAIWNQIKTTPSPEIRFEIPEFGSIAPGEAKTIPVRVRVAAPESQSSEGTVFVLIRNVPKTVQSETELWYCNFPETIETTGQVFGGRIQSGKPIRMLFHHVNEARKGLLFHSQVINASDKPATILLIPGESQVDKNPVFAGIEAAESFFRNWLSSSGEILTIPPHGSLPISMKRLAPHDTVSGLIYLALLEGGPDSVMVRADAKWPFQPDYRWSQALASNSPWRVLGALPIRGDEDEGSIASPHTYPVPFKELDVNYQVGGRHSFVRIGQQPIANSSGEMYLDGNFGVIYTIRARVENPTLVVAELEVVFEASAGYSGALFAVNGQLLRTPLLQPKDERRILRLRLEPGASRLFTMQTIPLSGSSYPITLAFRPLESTSRDIASSRKLKL